MKKRNSIAIAACTRLEVLHVNRFSSELVYRHIIFPLTLLLLYITMQSSRTLHYNAGYIPMSKQVNCVNNNYFCMETGLPSGKYNSMTSCFLQHYTRSKGLTKQSCIYFPGAKPVHGHCFTVLLLQPAPILMYVCIYLWLALWLGLMTSEVKGLTKKSS